MLVFGHLIFALFVPANSVEVIGEAIRTLEKIDEINIHLNGEITNKGFDQFLIDSDENVTLADTVTLKRIRERTMEF